MNKRNRYDTRTRYQESRRQAAFQEIIDAAAFLFFVLAIILSIYAADAVLN